ncbi:cell wall hydrolase [Novosphingobium sp.]|uniref:cell wall hydrolase n=1 Tax=Novosphingobium sp. TaxID=1874826 RepID=UPI0025F3E204|nr:cell wall hydrolase [Novosphingobium sp.]
MTTALRSTLSAISHDHATSRHFAALAAVLVAVPLCVSVKGLDSEVSAQTITVRHSAAADPGGQDRVQPLALPLPVSGVVPSLLDPATQSAMSINNLTRFAPPAALAPASAFRFSGSTDARDQAIGCLAAAAWYEAGNDAESQRSVIQVVLNRVKHPAFPKTVCGVVLQGSERRTGCQFSFTCDGSLARRRPASFDWQMARVRAESALAGAVDRDVADATHYHADYVVPWWSAKLEALTRVGRHIFYRWYGPGGRAQQTPGPENPNALALPRLGIGPSGAIIGSNHVASPAIVTQPRMQPDVAALTGIEAPDAIAPTAFAPSPQGAKVFALDMAQPAGRWALDALGKCNGGACHVFGYASAEAASRNAVLSDRAKEVPQFLLVKDRASGMTLAFWDCSVTQRPNPDQCLPSQPDALRSLLRERPGP